MKKQYKIITLVINLLLLVLFVVLEGVYTYETATKIMNEKWQEVNEYAGWSITKRSIDSDINITHYLYSDFEDSALFKSDDVGYYRALRKKLCKLINCDKNAYLEWLEKSSSKFFNSIQWIL